MYRHNMVAFDVPSHVDPRSASSIHDDLSVRVAMTKAVACRVPPDGEPTGGEQEEDARLSLGSITPLQVAHLIAYARGLRHGAYVHIGRASSMFAIINEYMDCVRDKCATMMCFPAISPEMLKYARHRFYRFSQISHTHDTFLKKIQEIVKPGDFVTVDLRNEDVASAINVFDVILQRGAELVLFNVKDANYPNIARVWKLMKSNSLLMCKEFAQTYDAADATGGGIGVARLVSQSQ